MSDQFDRVLLTEGIHNFRDYGGYRVKAGGHLVNRRLFRSAQHLDATPADLNRVGKIGFAAIIDLRSGSERRSAPCPRPDNFIAEIICSDQEPANAAPHLQALANSADAEQARQRMVEGYRELPYRDVLVELCRRYCDVLARVKGPSLIHCVAGKDRTGLAVALVHTLLGVHHDDMMDDYLLTNTAGNVEGRIAAGMHTARTLTDGEISPEVVREMLMARPEYLDAAMASINDRHGSVGDYIRDVIGVDATQKNQIEHMLVI